MVSVLKCIFVEFPTIDAGKGHHPQPGATFPTIHSLMVPSHFHKGNKLRHLSSQDLMMDPAPKLKNIFFSSQNNHSKKFRDDFQFHPLSLIKTKITQIDIILCPSPTLAQVL